MREPYSGNGVWLKQEDVTKEKADWLWYYNILCNGVEGFGLKGLTQEKSCNSNDLDLDRNVINFYASITRLVISSSEYSEVLDCRMNMGDQCQIEKGKQILQSGLGIQFEFECHKNENKTPFQVIRVFYSNISDSICDDYLPRNENI